MLKFGLFFELSVPRPWNDQSEWTVYHNALEQAKLADELGFDQLWVVEHHFLEEYSHSSAPELFLTAIAMVTKRAHVCHGIATCVPQINHPVRIAERAAVLDILSNGRMELGTGRASTWTELGAFGANPDDTKKYWDECIRAIPKMWTQERFSWEGKAFSMPSRAILPKPYQKPHPPLWVAVTTPSTILDAAERGCGSLGLTFGGFAEQERKVGEYRRRIAVCEPVGAVVTNQVNTVNFLYCHEENETGVRMGKRLAGTFSYMADQILMARQAYPTRSYAMPGLLPSLRQQATDGAAVDSGPEGIAIGNPERIVRELKKWESTGIDRVNFMINSLEVVPQEQVLESLRLFAREVMPKFTGTLVPALAATGGA